MRKSWIVIALTIVLTISTLVFFFVYQPIDNTQQIMSESWMFKGAYATYVGQIASLSFPYSINETIQVTDINATHVQVQTDSAIATPFSPALSDRTTLWVNKTNINFQPKGETLAGTYLTQITVKSIGLRECIAYEYVNEGINATYYVDKVFLWPVRIVYATVFENQTYTIEFSLKDTSIKGLN
jgi:hypothetical protein